MTPGLRRAPCAASKSGQNGLGSTMEWAERNPAREPTVSGASSGLGDVAETRRVVLSNRHRHYPVMALA